MKGDVLDPFKLVTSFPSQRVETLVLSEPQKHQVDACFLDWFAGVRSEIDRLKQLAARAESEAMAAKAAAEQDAQKTLAFEAELAEARLQQTSLRAELDIIRNSSSWRVTTPLRKLLARLRG